MGTINDLVDYQKEFDSLHSIKFKWNKQIGNDDLDVLLFLMSSLIGEAGEAINIVKKLVRGDATLLEKRECLVEELADVFIYLLKLSYQLDFNIEDAYYSKMKKNAIRFKPYQINGSNANEDV